ncbi:alkylation response protein AidB-like acyl-CoA dehydrogenase [Salsuginibacillus halophilus]|uniref:Alkylation response protein AidB-like acyl-CoA dehydrogenase n=1 Tax=Salsuginibacillus halophilus TaxID=517424 RepID=A0A2P8HI45_9BACI|nr:acyl-CoA dehydrogenase family protein [Salsuginibacillus halophilus]PSL45881.1 alkylation response protein AidB-like acyl-CoA dehydrogenase [Salsuginibacillus halophilus]
MRIDQQPTQQDRINALHKLAAPFYERADGYDQQGLFVQENIEALQAAGYPALTIPEKNGGLGISLTHMLELQETLARFDGSTALAIGWHLGITKHIGENETWPQAKYQAFAEDVKQRGALLNNASSEPATGSPTRGGRPETTAERTEEGWEIHGRKTFTTLAPALDYIVVTAGIKGSEDVASFLIRRELTGVYIEETWNAVAMRGTGSHDLVLNGVHVGAEDLLQYMTPGEKGAQGWLLHIPACYLGIARAAQHEALTFALNYSPNSIEGTISELPNVKQKLGELEAQLMAATHFLYSVARKWDDGDQEVRSRMKPELGTAKMHVVNAAVEVVDTAMRICGAHSLAGGKPLQRYHRDVRAGLHNPPMDDMTVMMLAETSKQRVQELL